jgi:hypothetical protein
MTNLHPARTRPFRDLVDALQSARAQRLVCEQAGPDGLRLYAIVESAKRATHPSPISATRKSVCDTTSFLPTSAG